MPASKLSDELCDEKELGHNAGCALIYFVDERKKRRSSLNWLTPPLPPPPPKSAATKKPPIGAIHSWPPMLPTQRLKPVLRGSSIREAEPDGVRVAVCMAEGAFDEGITVSVGDSAPTKEHEQKNAEANVIMRAILMVADAEQGPRSGCCYCSCFAHA